MPGSQRRLERRLDMATKELCTIVESTSIVSTSSRCAVNMVDAIVREREREGEGGNLRGSGSRSKSLERYLVIHPGSVDATSTSRWPMKGCSMRDIALKQYGGAARAGAKGSTMVGIIIYGEASVGIV